MYDSSIVEDDIASSNKPEQTHFRTLLREKLLQITKTLQEEKLLDAQLLCLIHSGTYSELVLKILSKKGILKSYKNNNNMELTTILTLPGASKNVIIKGMKFGLINLDIRELQYFEDFNISPLLFQNEQIWSEIVDHALIVNLKSIGLSDAECWSIIIQGLKSQDGCILLKLLVSGIDVTGILDWQGPAYSVNKKMLQFFTSIGLEENIINHVNENGINDEALIIMRKLGYTENQQDPYEILSRYTTSTSKSQILSTSESEEIDSPPCTCNQNYSSKIGDQTELTAQRNDYLRQTVMVPLTWAISKTLKYKPSDPLHYIAHQLLRWKYNNIPESEKAAVHNTVAFATIQMDNELVKRRHWQGHKTMRKKTVENDESVPCNECLDTVTSKSVINFTEILRGASSSSSMSSSFN